MEEKYKLAEWLDDKLSENELEDFKNNEDFLIYEKIKKYSSELETPHFDQDSMLSNILRIEKESPKVIPLYNKAIFKIAAVVLVFISVYYFYTVNSPVIVVAENNQKTEFLLPDNSEIVLNSGSTIEYKKNNWDSNRNLKLKGEAYFKVAKGKTFEVQTNIGKVQVLGTQFNVSTNNNTFNVMCFEGKVKVNHNNKEIVLNPTESVTFKDGELISNQKINYAKPSWINNQLEYSKTNLSDLLIDISKQYGITIKNEINIERQLFSGNIPSNNLETALKIIASTYQVKFTKVNQNTYALETL